MTTLNEKLNSITGQEPSNWYKKAKERQQNRSWLQYSANIALRVLAAIESKEGMTQKKLAEQVGVSPQQISKIVKGQENLTLETILRLSEALEIALISFPAIQPKGVASSIVGVADMVLER